MSGMSFFFFLKKKKVRCSVKERQEEHTADIGPLCFLFLTTVLIYIYIRLCFKEKGLFSSLIKGLHDDNSRRNTSLKKNRKNRLYKKKKKKKSMVVKRQKKV